MNLKELLIAQGVAEEQATKILEAMTANKLYIATEEHLDVRYAKAKKELDQAKTDLADANKLVATLKKDNADVEALQTKVTEYEKKMIDLEAERSKERKTYAIKEALTQAGASDIDYMMYRLGDVELEEDGSIKDLENKVKQLKEGNPTFFTPTEPPKDDDKSTKGGYKPIDTKLKGGDPKVFDIDEMSIEEINENWDAIKAQTKK